MYNILGQHRALLAGMRKGLGIGIGFLLDLAAEAHLHLLLIAIEVYLIEFRDLTLDQDRFRGEIVNALDHITVIHDRPVTFLIDISLIKPMIPKINVQ